MDDPGWGPNFNKFTLKLKHGLLAKLVPTIIMLSWVVANHEAQPRKERNKEESSYNFYKQL